jgi:hypothetical protein
VRVVIVPPRNNQAKEVTTKIMAMQMRCDIFME